MNIPNPIGINTDDDRLKQIVSSLSSTSNTLVEPSLTICGQGGINIRDCGWKLSSERDGDEWII